VKPVIGVLALQGDIAEHMRALELAGAQPVRVRSASDLAAVSGLVIPGGESTAIMKLLRVFNMVEPIRERIKAGMPVYGSCAGMILLADNLVNPARNQETIGGLHATVRRNAFGRQVDSFEVDLPFAGLAGPPIRTVFIRAPWIEHADADVQPLARIPEYDAQGHRLTNAAGKIVAARQGNILVTAFHPEVTNDIRIHELFVNMVHEAM